MSMELITDYLSASASERTPLFRKLVSALTPMTAADPDEAGRILRRIVGPDLTYSEAQILSQAMSRLPRSGKARQDRRLAILGTFTIPPLADFIRLYCFGLGLTVEIYTSEYGVIEQELLDPNSALHAFRPDVLYLATNQRALGRRPQFSDQTADVDDLVAAEVARWSGLWNLARERLGCQVIQDNFALPPFRPLDNLEMRHPAGFGRFIARVNQALQEAAPAHVVVHDADFLSATAGRYAWTDYRFYYHAKLPCAPEFLPAYARSVASLVGALAGKSRKCLVLDLDNTLWGGVVGDDGIGGIRLGQGEAEGEAYQAFQAYVQSLARRGVVLAVCSKNDEKLAREVFEQHDEMLLKLGDIACFIANWENKTANLRTIAQTLGLGLDALVFVDDHPAERAAVRRYLPEVAVPEMPADPANYIEAIDRHLFFQTVAVVREDLQRGEMYRANARRDEAERGSDNIDEFLRSLEMRARVARLGPEQLERAAQLVARSNQFNLTTRRRSAAALASLLADPAWSCLAVTLTDRFGESGLVSVVLARMEQTDLVIDTWLMSCRVLKRGIESLLRNSLCAIARSRGASALVGEYIPTEKNALVAEHYRTLGFAPAGGNLGEACRWRLEVAGVADLPHVITAAP
jgi:FkbH-like protein